MLLIALSSSDSAQSIHSMRVDNCICTAKGVEFPIFLRPNTSRHIRRPKVVICPRWSDPNLDVGKCVTTQMDRTLTFRCKTFRQGKTNPPNCLSHKSGLSVTRNRISRWLTEVMSLAGIDTSYFKAHFTRGAGINKAKSRGAIPSQIVQQGDWTNVSTWERH